MTRDSLAAVIPVGGPVVLDSSALLAYLSGRERVSPAATIVLDGFVRSGRNPGLVSMIAMTELLVRPFRSGTTAVGEVETFLAHFPGLELVPVDAQVAREAARVRAMTGLRTPDAIVIATALHRRAQFVVTNDDRWRSAIDLLGGQLRLCHLDAHA